MQEQLGREMFTYDDIVGREEIVDYSFQNLTDFMQDFIG